MENSKDSDQTKAEIMYDSVQILLKDLKLGDGSDITINLKSGRSIRGGFNMGVCPGEDWLTIDFCGAPDEQGLSSMIGYELVPYASIESLMLRNDV